MDGDSTKFWELWSSTFESTLLKLCGIDQAEAKPFRGRGMSIRKGATAKGTAEKRWKANVSRGKITT